MAATEGGTAIPEGKYRTGTVVTLGSTTDLQLNMERDRVFQLLWM
jgi:hypothetical protein